MKHICTSRRLGMFDPLASPRLLQAAAMTLRPGQASSERVENEHPGSEQWLLVISGTGKATVGKRHVAIKPGSLLLIEKGERHQIRNTGRKNLVTMNFYAPPAYRPDGE